MFKSFLFLVLFGSLLVISCQKDDNTADENILRYDGENQTGPLLEPGNFEAAARFTSSQTSKYAGKKLTAVQWFMGKVPQNVKVKIYGPGTASSPGTLLFASNDVTSSLRALAWNELPLPSPINITGEDLWISITFTHTQVDQSIGCDAGPNKPNGDWLFNSNDGNWQTYVQRTGESVNWNIRGKVGE